MLRSLPSPPSPELLKEVFWAKVELTGTVAMKRAVLYDVLALYALCGVPFAGKPTIAVRLAEQTDAVLVRLDAINLERGVGLDGAAISADDWRHRTA
ncbi:MAG: hypothetical protein JO057_03415 [Chloroflexi bacterium]|nr:hypothetical protein [Chloroflexota bacterium]